MNKLNVMMIACRAPIIQHSSASPSVTTAMRKLVDRLVYREGAEAQLLRGDGRPCHATEM